MNKETLSILAQISACNARIAAMQALNSARLQDGLSPGYAESCFWEEASTLESLEIEARRMP